MKKYISTVLFICYALLANAQGQSDGAGFMAGSLKMYVSVAVLGIILSCIFIFLFVMEKQLKQLEERQKS